MADVLHRRPMRRAALLLGGAFAAAACAAPMATADRLGPGAWAEATARVATPSPAPLDLQMTVPDGWTSHPSVSHVVPAAAPDSPTYVRHTRRWTAGPDVPLAAQMSLAVMAGPTAQTLAQVQQFEAAPVLWETEREEQVILVRQEALSGGLTIASWDESPELNVAVVASGNVTLEQVKIAVESARVRPA